MRADGVRGCGDIVEGSCKVEWSETVGIIVVE